jgi:hypothetical protein
MTSRRAQKRATKTTTLSWTVWLATVLRTEATAKCEGTLREASLEARRSAALRRTCGVVAGDRHDRGTVLPEQPCVYRYQGGWDAARP